MAAATASASAGSRALPSASVFWSCLKTALGRRRCWTAPEKTFSPKTLAPGWVRSAVPSAPPLGLHWAAWTFWLRRRGIGGWVLLRGERGQPRRARTAGLAPGGERFVLNFRQRAKDPSAHTA